MKFKIIYKDDFHEVKEVTYEASSYEDVYNFAGAVFGKNLIKCVAMDQEADNSKRRHEYEESILIF